MISESPITVFGRPMLIALENLGPEGVILKLVARLDEGTLTRAVEFNRSATEGMILVPFVRLAYDEVCARVVASPFTKGFVR